MHKAATAKPAKPRLGRGLSSLITMPKPPAPAPVPAAAPAPAVPPVMIRDGRPLDLPIEQIAPNPHQPRRTFNDATLNELASSLKAAGIIQPIVVRPVGEKSYQLIAGERRLRAAKLAGFTQVPVIVKDVDPLTQAQLALIENIQREDLNPIERADGYASLLRQLGLSQAELALRLGEDRSTIANFVRLLDLAEPVKELLRSGRLSTGHAKILAGVSDILEQQRLASLIVQQELSVRNLERLMRDAPAPKPAATSEQTVAVDAHMKHVAKSIGRQTGWRVQVRASARQKGAGKLVIHYTNLDQFDEICDRIGVNLADD
jgi:ParB family chromosome partitioning protein